MLLERIKEYVLIRISHVIIQGELSNPNEYTITSGNKWLEKFENLCMIHPDLKQKRPAFSIDWKSGRINRWEHDCEVSSGWTFKNVTLTYIDKKGHTLLQVQPEEFRFHYNISRNGVIKNWKSRKTDFTSILRWSLDNLL